MNTTPLLQRSTTPFPTVRLIASPKSWIEARAVRQLYASANREGISLAVGFPDLHPGDASPVGAAFVAEDVIHPLLIGCDIGCGMALFKTDLPRCSADRLGEWADYRFDLEHSWEGDVGPILDAFDLESTHFNAALGTIGSGNHFAEVQFVERVFDSRKLKRLGIGAEQLVILVHSGSRGLGEAVLRDYLSEHGDNGASAESPAAQCYLRGHDVAVRWARANRALIAQRFVEALGAEAECIWDGCHNGITPLPEASAWIHRRGAVAADAGPVVIPGSRGSLSYLVQPRGDGESHAWSLAHGAGRKWPRSEARLRMRERFSVPELTETPLGGRVICEDRSRLYEEAPAAYKNIEAVIEDLADAGLVSVIATFRPLLTYKTRAAMR